MTTIKPIPFAIQLLLTGASQINTYKLLVEELIYNALDAEASSLAIRINIEENFLQVLDNGVGIVKNDMKLLGQKNYTSKHFDGLNQGKHTYGYNGQSLANIIQVTKTVKITSRSNFSDKTWCKIFHTGREEEIKITDTRPSKGTTVEIIGFLYNLNIQKKIINPIREIENIKRFLEQLSLVKNNISISLRDDLKNEIIFQLHKSRDIYQTFLVLFGYKKNEILELHVEKKYYKAVAYFGKKLSNTNEHDWIYLNGRLLSPCILHKIVHDSITKLFCLKNNKYIAKNKKHKDDKDKDQVSITQNIPFFFILITCPYTDYDFISTNKQPQVEFKNWNQITNIIEKLIKFYTSDKNVVKIYQTDIVKSKIERNKSKGDMKEQVNEIVQRILASNSKKLGVSQMQNGVKGKVLKRKKYNAKDTKKLLTINKRDNSEIGKQNNDCLSPKKSICVKQIVPKASPILKNKINFKPRAKKCESKVKQTSLHENDIKDKNMVSHHNDIDEKGIFYSKKNNKITTRVRKRKNGNTKTEVNNKILKSFEHVTDTLKQRCHVISADVDNILKEKIKAKPIYNLNRNTRIFQTTTLENDDQKLSIKQYFAQTYSKDVDNLCRKLQKHDLRPNYFGTKSYVNNQIDVFNKNKKNNVYMSSYDLLETVLTQNDKNGVCTQHNSVDNDLTIETLPRLTYQSHRRYNIDVTITTTRKRNVIGNNFITRQSRENFESTNKVKDKRKISKSKYVESKKFNNYSKFCNIQESSYTIEYLNSNNYQESDIYHQNHTNFGTYNHEVITNTYTITRKKHSINLKTDHNNFSDHFETFNEGINKTYTLPNQTKRFQKSYYFEHFEPLNQDIDKTYTIGNEMDQCLDYDGDVMNSNLVNNSLETIDESRLDFVSKSSKNNVKDIACIEDSNNVEEKANITCIEDCNYAEKNAKRNEISQNLEKNNLMRSNDTYSEDISDKVNVENELNFDDYLDITESHNAIDPVTVCETVFDSSPKSIVEFDPILATQEQNCKDSLFDSKHNTNDAMDLVVESNVVKTSNEVMIEQMEQELYEIEQEINTLGSDFKENNNVGEKFTLNKDEFNKDVKLKTIEKNGKTVTLHKTTGMCISTKDNNSFGGDYGVFQIDFNLENRPRFIPKGLSPILKNCNTKSACDYTMDKEYFDDDVYHEFVKTVQTNTDIFEPCIQNLQENASKEICKVNTRINKDHSSLSFNGHNLEGIKVFGQVDRKFIAAKIESNTSKTGKVSEYLVLFDQHAVHERIRLENNMADYISKDQWKSINLDEFTLNLRPEEVMYLHNYKDKFNLFGLKWNILSEQEISVFGIPVALLGKHIRQVEVIIKAVKNLIIEEILAIKAQKGSISMYPKSIMDLVFSEACRYAIKFGDILSKTECMELLNGLSKCKTPFQCAHGRPVMAVLTELDSNNHSYKSDFMKLQKFMNKKK